MPAFLLRCYTVMLSRLEAERALDRIAQTGAGTGVMKQADQERLLRDLREEARGPRRTRAPKASPAFLARIGAHMTPPPAARKEVNDDG